MKLFSKKLFSKKLESACCGVIFGSSNTPLPLRALLGDREGSPNGESAARGVSMMFMGVMFRVSRDAAARLLSGNVKGCNDLAGFAALLEGLFRGLGGYSFSRLTSSFELSMSSWSGMMSSPKGTGVPWGLRGVRAGMGAAFAGEYEASFS